jgi:hypothetical protein
MSVANATDPFKGHKTRRPGVTYRVRKDGSRTYYVAARGKQFTVEGGGEAEAFAYQDELRQKVRRRQPLITERHTFEEAAEAAYDLNRSRWSPRVATNYRSNLDRYVLPYFQGDVSSFDWESISREFLQKTLLASSQSLGGTLTNALRDGSVPGHGADFQAVPIHSAIVAAFTKLSHQRNPFEEGEHVPAPRLMNEVLRRYLLSKPVARELAKADKRDDSAVAAEVEAAAS